MQLRFSYICMIYYIQSGQTWSKIMSIIGWKRIARKKIGAYKSKIGSSLHIANKPIANLTTQLVSGDLHSWLSAIARPSEMELYKS